jgi:uncharacterized ion transporter superfamily protein YfcC
MYIYKRERERESVWCVCVCVCVCVCMIYIIYIYMYKERYEQNKEEILKYRRERYRTIHTKHLNIKVSTGTFTLYFD